MSWSIALNSVLRESMTAASPSSAHCSGCRKLCSTSSMFVQNKDIKTESELSQIKGISATFGHGHDADACKQRRVNDAILIDVEGWGSVPNMSVLRKINALCKFKHVEILQKHDFDALQRI